MLLSPDTVSVNATKLPLSLQTDSESVPLAVAYMVMGFLLGCFSMSLLPELSVVWIATLSCKGCHENSWAFPISSMERLYRSISKNFLVPDTFCSAPMYLPVGANAKLSIPPNSFMLPVFSATNFKVWSGTMTANHLLSFENSCMTPFGNAYEVAPFICFRWSTFPFW